MTKILIILFLVMFFTPDSALAQTSSSRPNIQQRVEANQEKREEIRQEVKERFTALRKQQIRNFFGRTITRYEAAIERLEKIIEKINERLSQDTELDQSQLIERLDDQKDILAEAKSDLANIPSMFEDIFNQTDPKLAFKEVKEELAKIRQSLVEVRIELSKIIGEIKGLRTQNEE